MTAVIYWFSGTGNSLYVAREAAKRFADCQLVSMAKLAGQKEVEIGREIDVVGLVCPVYYYDTPGFVEDFVRKLRFIGQPYVFAIAACGGGPGNVLFSLERLLKERGVKLSAGFTVDMPSNAYALVNLVTPPEQRDGMLQDAGRRLREILDVVGKKEASCIPGGYGIIRGVSSSLMRLGTSKGYRMWRRYRADERCTGCGTCQKICPTGNIKVVEKTVTWGDNCAECQACFHWCPRRAIQLDRRTPKVSRYHHPEVKIQDMTVR